MMAEFGIGIATSVVRSNKIFRMDSLLNHDTSLAQKYLGTVIGM